jgi:ankyrin repeat protein
VTALLAHQADPNAQMTKGTPMRRNSQDFELPKTLIGATPYLLAAKFLEADIMRALAAAGADTRLAMKDGATPLMAASGMGITAPVQDEKRGTDRRGLAILDGGKVEPDSQVLEAVSAALALGSDINAVNPAGDTAVHIAAAQGYGEVVKLLASQGADLNVRNEKGLTPLASVATRAGRKSMVDLLRSLGASE